MNFELRQFCSRGALRPETLTYFYIFMTEKYIKTLYIIINTNIYYKISLKYEVTHNIVIHYNNMTTNNIENLV